MKADLSKDVSELGDEKDKVKTNKKEITINGNSKTTF